MSVVLPTHDRARRVTRAVKSVLAQSYPHIELLVIDDGSRDGTRDVLARFGGAIEVLAQRHAGAYVARNLGISHARGELIAFIDSDDAWYPDRIARQLPLMRPRTGLVFGNVAHVGVDGMPLGDPVRTSFTISPPHRGAALEELAWANFIPTISVLARRSCLEEVGLFPTTHRLSGDYLTWFRIAARHELEYVPEAVADYTVHSGGASSDLGRALTARIELFRRELASTSDPARRSTLERLVFNLGLHMMLALARGRARPAGAAWAVTREALSVVTPAAAPAMTAAFARRQLSLKTGRAAA